MSSDLFLSPLLLGLLALAGAVTLIVLWRVFGRGPRRARGLGRIRRQLQQGDWAGARERLRKLRTLGKPGRQWQDRFNALEADCLQAAMSAALDGKKFEEALDYAIPMMQLRDKPTLDAQMQIQGAMLEEMRRLYAIGSNSGVQDLVTRTLLVQSPCREASFWQGMSYLREGRTEEGVVSLQTARTGEARTLWLGESLAQPGASGATLSSFLEPSLYLGALLLRQGQAKEALRYLTEANRLDNNCPFVTAQLGTAMIQAGGDTAMAVRALQRSLGPKGFGQWAGNPARAWVEGFSEQRSYIRKLAGKHPFVCPLWGSDLQVLLRQGDLALAQGLYRLGQFQESCDLFAKLLREGAPSWAVLRGLGLALARLGKYDEAFKHLRTAHEMEETKDRITAGYLALCGAMGKPSRPEAKAQNITWAISLVTRFNAPGDTEWTTLVGNLFAEAREHQVPQTLDDQVYLCEHLWSVQADDPQSAQAYLHLQATYPQAVRPEYAWLFCRAAQQHGITGPHTLDLFALTFAHEAEARAFYRERQWDFEEIEFTYLARAAALAPGGFPAALGPDYPARGRNLLVERSRQHELVGQLVESRVVAEILAQLDPHQPAVLERLACLHDRSGQPEQALEMLSRWHEAHPQDPLPLVRQAVFLYRRGEGEQGRQRLHQALALSRGRQKAAIAFFAARLVLQQGIEAANLDVAQGMLQVCVTSQPDHLEGLECLAAVRWLRGDMAGLATQANSMDRADVAEGRFHFAAALCHLAAEDHGRALEACQRVLAVTPTAMTPGRNGTSPPAAELDLGREASYLAGLAYLSVSDLPSAMAALQPVAEAATSPSAAVAQAILGNLSLAANQPEDAVKWWQMLDAKTRAGWKLNEPLAATVFLTAVAALEAGRYEEAAEKFRTAGKFGSRDRQLGPLLVLSLFRAGQQAMQS